MAPPAEQKIVRFRTGVDSNGASACEACGSPRQTASFCRACAFQLVDISLSSTSEASVASDDDYGRAKESAGKTLQVRYDHYELCTSLEGEPWELGRGAMGITYKATDTHLKCPVALKIINARRLGGVEARDRFLREARTAANLRHPNIASVFHLGLGEEHCFYAMEYIEGETLDARIRRDGPLPYRTALLVLSQCARALRVAHLQRFIHRDIKPTNIMLAADEQHSAEGVTTKLIDFGLVKTAEDASRDGLCETYFAGTPSYASPEQMAFGRVDPRSDIYSLGLCFEFMLTGIPPQASYSPGQDEKTKPLLPSAVDERLKGIPKIVVALSMLMVSPDPVSRPQNADQLLLRIADCLASTAIPVPDDLTITLTRAAAKRKSFHKSLSFAVLMLGALLVAWGIKSGLSFLNHGEGGNPRTTVISEQSKTLYAQAGETFRRYTKEDTKRAIELYSKAIELSPSFADAHALLASCLYEDVTRYRAAASELDAAFASANRAIAIDPNSPKAYVMLGAIYGYRGEHWNALAQLHRALELDPKSLPAMCDFSLHWICVGEPQMALPWAQEATKVEPTSIQGWHAAAEASVELCADQRAEECYQRCAELRPMWMSPYCGLIHLHLLQGDFVRARKDWAKAESIEPGLLCPLTLKAQIALFEGAYSEAEQSYRQLLKMDRRGSVSYYSGISYLSALGFLRRQAGDTAECNTLLEEAMTLHPADSEGPADVYDLAAIRAIQGREEDALNLLHQAILSGWNDYRATRFDPRFGSLRPNPRFQSMMANLENHVGQIRGEADRLCMKTLDLADFPVKPTKILTLTRE